MKKIRSLLHFKLKSLNNHIINNDFSRSYKGLLGLINFIVFIIILNNVIFTIGKSETIYFYQLAAVNVIFVSLLWLTLPVYVSFGYFSFIDESRKRISLLPLTTFELFTYYSSPIMLHPYTLFLLVLTVTVSLPLFLTLTLYRAILFLIVYILINFSVALFIHHLLRLLNRITGFKAGSLISTLVQMVPILFLYINYSFIIIDNRIRLLLAGTPYNLALDFNKIYLTLLIPVFLPLLSYLLFKLGLIKEKHDRAAGLKRFVSIGSNKVLLEFYISKYSGTIIFSFFLSLILAIYLVLSKSGVNGYFASIIVVILINNKFLLDPTGGVINKKRYLLYPLEAQKIVINKTLYLFISIVIIHIPIVVSAIYSGMRESGLVILINTLFYTLSFFIIRSCLKDYIDEDYLYLILPVIFIPVLFYFFVISMNLILYSFFILLLTGGVVLFLRKSFRIYSETIDQWEI